jgi:hypothetical protein
MVGRIPYANYFRVHLKWECTEIADKSDHSKLSPAIKVRCKIGVTILFHKRTWLEKIVLSNTRVGCRKGKEVWSDLVVAQLCQFYMKHDVSSSQADTGISDATSCATSPDFEVADLFCPVTEVLPSSSSFATALMPSESLALELNPANTSKLWEVVVWKKWAVDGAAAVSAARESSMPRPFLQN